MDIEIGSQDVFQKQTDFLFPRPVLQLNYLSWKSNADPKMCVELWDTAGQERFRSIMKLYYRGASAVLLVYSMTDESSFEEMGLWLSEMRENLDNDVVIHVVRTKSDLVAQEPSLRKIPFERCIAYVAENLYPQKASTPTFPSGSARSSGFWGQEIGTFLGSHISPIRTEVCTESPAPAKKRVQRRAEPYFSKKVSLLCIFICALHTNLYDKYNIMRICATRLREDSNVNVFAREKRENAISKNQISLLFRSCFLIFLPFFRYVECIKR